MYGLVNQGLKDMVCHQAGIDAWREVCAHAGMATDDFDLLQPYDDASTARLVSSISEILNISESDVLIRFGSYWVTFTAQQGYGPIMDLFGKDFRSCLRNLNRMHAHMGAVMPKLCPPRFEVYEEGAASVHVHYFSSRQGLSPMVLGLLQGLADKFGERVSINMLNMLPSASATEGIRFKIEFLAV
jgi:hypothetical protein